METKKLIWIGNSNYKIMIKRMKTIRQNFGKQFKNQFEINENGLQLI